MCECVSFSASKIMKKSLDGFPVSFSWVFKELSEIKLSETMQAMLGQVVTAAYMRLPMASQ